MDPKSKKRKRESHGKAPLLDLNLPAPVESESDHSETDSKERQRKKIALAQAKQHLKRKERMKNEPIYATARRAMLYKAHKKWKSKRDSKLNDEQRQQLREKRKVYNHTNYLKRKAMFDGHNSKEEQEIAQISAAVRKGQQITPEDRQKVIDFRKKKKIAADVYRAKRKSLDAGKQDEPK